MSERTAERSRETDSDDTAATSAEQTDSGVDVLDDAPESDDDTSAPIVSLRALVVAFVAVGLGMTLGSLVPVIPFTALAGVPVGAFLHGLLDRHRRYVESALAGGALAGVAVVTSLLPQLLAGLNGTRLFAIAAAVGGVLAVVGHYFGRDLRDGLTRDLS